MPRTTASPAAPEASGSPTAAAAVPARRRTPPRAVEMPETLETPARRPRPPAKKTPKAAQPVEGAAAAPAGRPGAAASAPPGRRMQSLERKRTAILDAALHCFSRLGLHGTSVDQVAARAQVSKSNLLYYFGSKEDLYVAVLRDLLALWLEPLREEFLPDHDPADAIRRYIARKMADSRDHPDASRLFCLEMVRGAPLLRDELDRGLRPLVEEKAAVVRGWIAAGRMAPVDPHHLVFLLWSATQHYADFAVQVEAISGRTLADPAFFEEAVAGVQALVLGGALGARIVAADGLPAADAPGAGTRGASPAG